MCEQVIRIPVIGICRVSYVQGIYVFVSWKVVWKVIYVFESELEADVTP
jgi:hypothetical protein